MWIPATSKLIRTLIGLAVAQIDFTFWGECRAQYFAVRTHLFREAGEPCPSTKLNSLTIGLGWSFGGYGYLISERLPSGSLCKDLRKMRVALSSLYLLTVCCTLGPRREPPGGMCR